MASTPSRKLRYEQHILETQQIKTPPHSNNNKTSNATSLKPLLHSNSSGSNPSTSSDPPKSFLALSAESSPSTTRATDSSPYSASTSQHTAAAAAAPPRRAAPLMNSANLVNTIKSRFEAESSKTPPKTSPTASRSIAGHFNRSTDYSEAGSSSQRLEPSTKPSPPKSRGSRLGAQMGRTRSEQTNAASRNEPPSISNSFTSPIRRGNNDTKEEKPAYSARMNRDMQSYSPSTRSPSLDINAYFATAEARSDASSSLRGSLLTPSPVSQRLANGMAALSANGTEDPSPTTSQSALARRIEAENEKEVSSLIDGRRTGAMSIIPPRDMQGQGGSSQQISLQGDLHSSAATSPSVTSPSHSSNGGHMTTVGPRVGKLSQLQYNKADPVLRQSGPSWDMSAAASRSASLASRPSLVGRVSNPNMLSDFKKGEHQSEVQWTEPNGVYSELDGSPAQQNHATLEGTNRSAERRELMLPALNGMRSAVESVLSTETFIRKEERRRSATAFHPPTTPSDRYFAGGQSSQTMSPREAALAEVWHRRTPSLEAGTSSPPISIEAWQRVSEAPRQNGSGVRPDYPLSSSPIPTSTERRTAVTVNDANAKVGHLSDEAIVRLGAVPSIDPSSLLNPNGQPLSSKNILTIALQKAQSAVLLDSANNVPDAILAYQQAVRLLLEVMERVSPKNTSGSRRKSSREEERRRLKVIHDTYADRIRLLSMINAPDDGLGDSSIGEDSFTRQSPTPVRTKKSSGALVLSGLGIKESKVSEQAPPQIAIALPDVDSSGNLYDHAARQKENREAMLDVSTTKAERHNSMHGSDSEGSFRSARDPYSRPSADGFPLLSPVSDRLQRQSSRNSAGDEITSMPVTPYFDTESGVLVANLNSPARIGSAEGDQTYASSRPSTSTVATLRPESPAEKRQRSPQDRISRGITSLHSIPSAVDIAASNALPSRRLLSLGSEAQFQVGGNSSSPLRGRVEEGQSSVEDKAAMGKDAVFGNRPRALTLGVNEHGRMLVSSTVTSGMISQRRKMAGSGLGLGGGPKSIEDNVFRSDGGVSLQLSFDSVLSPNGSAGEGAIAGGKVAASSDDDPDISSDVKFSAGRKRAISQPGNRRPSIPASFKTMIQSQTGITQGPPPVPKIKRKASMPLAPLVFAQQQQQQQQGTTKAPSNGNSTFRFPSPAPSASSGYHALGTPSAVSGQYPWCASNASEVMSTTMSDLFPTSLPSLQMGAVPSYTSNSYPVQLPWIGVTSALPDNASFALPPAQRMLRPFHVMNLLQASIGSGAYITKRLYLSRDLWLQSGSRLLAIETKVRMLDSISNGIEGVEQAGRFLLRSSTSMDQPGLNAINASKFLKVLEEFETLLIEVQNTLAKKLGFLETVDGKKSGSSFGSLSSKFTRSLDRMTNNAKSHIDTPANYVDGLSRLFIRAQVIGEHLRTLDKSKRELESPTKESEWDGINIETYVTLPPELKRSIEFKLKRASEFFTSVILRFVLRDVAILVDKSVKRNAVLLTE